MPPVRQEPKTGSALFEGERTHDRQAPQPPFHLLVRDQPSGTVPAPDRSTRRSVPSVSALRAEPVGDCQTAATANL